MAGLDATETGNELSQPTFEFTSLPLISFDNIQADFVTIIMRHVNTDNDAVDAFKVLDKSGGGAISRYKEIQN